VSEPRVLTRPLGASRLAAAAMAGDLDAAWFPPAPRDPAAWKALAESRRAAFAANDWHTALAPAFGASGVAAARLARSAAGRGIVVTTGQQPGLFGGPMYTWSKALSTLALADALERASGMPVAPVFWAATYDSDFAEAAVTYVARDGEVERLAMSPPEIKDRRMYDTPLGDVRLLAAMLERASGAAVDRSVLEAMRYAYDPSHTIGSAFVQLVRGVLEPLGIAVLDAGHPAVTAAARSCTSAALASAAAIDTALLAREKELKAAGFDAKVPHVKGHPHRRGREAGNRRCRSERPAPARGGTGDPPDRRVRRGARRDRVLRAGERRGARDAYAAGDRRAALGGHDRGAARHAHPRAARARAR
jgi:hypothetical protein